jgi:hypothetical protein
LADKKWHKGVVMSITVDHEILPAEKLGFQTIGEVFTYIQRENRLVVQVLIDGEEPQTTHLGEVRRTLLENHIIYIETADPGTLALEVLDDVQRQLGDAETAKEESARLLQKNQSAKALEQLGRTIHIWQHAQESVSKVSELLRIDLAGVKVSERLLKDMLREFSEQLRQIKSALHQRDLVLLSDVLLYETSQTTENWRSVLHAMQQMIQLGK